MESLYIVIGQKWPRKIK